MTDNPNIQAGPFEVLDVRPLSPEEKRQRWLEERHKGVGASEVAALFGLDPYGKTIQELYDEKVNPLPPDQVPENPDQLRGQYLEDDIIHYYGRRTGREIVPIGLQVHPLDPHMLATPDGLIVLPEKPTVEVKSVRQKKLGYMKAKGLSDGWILQVQAQLEVTRAPWGAFIYHAADPWEMQHFDFERDAAIGEAILAKIKEFWWYVENKVRPVTPLAYDLPQLETVPGTIIQRKDAEFLEVVGQYREAKTGIKTFEDLASIARGRLEEICGAHGSYEGGGVRVHYKMRKGRGSFSRENLTAAAPLDPIGVTLVLAELIKDPEQLKAILSALKEKAMLDLGRFMTPGEPYEEIRTYDIKGGDVDETNLLPPAKLRLEKGD